MERSEWMTGRAEMSYLIGVTKVELISLSLLINFALLKLLFLD